MQNALIYDKSLEIEKLNIKRRECMGEIMKVLEKNSNINEAERFRVFSRSDLPFVLIILFGDSHAMPGCLVHIVVRLYPHFTRQCAKTLQASAQEKWNAIKRPINR